MERDDINEMKNKAGYTATSVACGWAGAVKVSASLETEKYVIKN